MANLKSEFAFLALTIPAAMVLLTAAPALAQDEAAAAATTEAAAPAPAAEVAKPAECPKCDCPACPPCPPPPPPAPAADAVEWKAQSKGGMLITGGNSQSKNFTFGVNASRKEGNNKLAFEGGLAYGTSNNSVATVVDADEHHHRGRSPGGREHQQLGRQGPLRPLPHGQQHGVSPAAWPPRTRSPARPSSAVDSSATAASCSRTRCTPWWPSSATTSRTSATYRKARPRRRSGQHSLGARLRRRDAFADQGNRGHGQRRGPVQPQQGRQGHQRQRRHARASRRSRIRA